VSSPGSEQPGSSSGAPGASLTPTPAGVGVGDGGLGAAGADSLPQSAGSDLPPVPVEDPDSLSVKESSIFERVEAHGLSVRKWTAGFCLFVIVVLYLAGLGLLWQSALFAKHLCAPAAATHHAEGAASAASAASESNASVRVALPHPVEASSPASKAGKARASHKPAPAASVASAPAMSASAASSSAESVSGSCGNALALINSHAMAGALLALFSIPTVLLIILLRAFAPAKQEKEAVPDTAVSWLAEKLAAILEKLTTK
jgi:hypothetical protein